MLLQNEKKTYNLKLEKYPKTAHLSCSNISILRKIITDEFFFCFELKEHPYLSVDFDRTRVYGKKFIFFEFFVSVYESEK